MKPKDPQSPSGPIKIKNRVVRIDRDICIGAASCSTIAPKTFGLDEHSKAILVDTVGEDPDGQIMEAAKSCPVLAIIIENEKGEKIFPV